MTEQQELQLWRLVAALSVVDAAILIAGGDPSAVDREEVFNGNLVDVSMVAVFTIALRSSG